MTSLRQRMTEDMQVRNLALNTQMSYVQQVSLFARHFNKSPEQLGPEDIRSYQVYLTNEKKLAPGSIVIAVSALRFLYKVSLKRDWTFDEVIPAPKKPQTLPVILSPEEVLRFLGCVSSRKHHAILTTCYAAGLRISEAVRLTVPDIDSARMVIRVDQGKGRKDRYVMLSPKLREILRDWWRVEKPSHWLFPGDIEGRHITKDAVELACQNARLRFPVPKSVTPHACATLLPFICSNPEPMSARFSCYSVTAASPPQPDTCGSPPARCAQLRVPSICCLILCPSISLLRLRFSERHAHGSPEAGSGGCLSPLWQGLPRTTWRVDVHGAAARHERD
jgi:integrase/recombinase XerD